MRVEGRIEHVGKVLRPAVLQPVVGLPGERHAEIDIGRDGERRVIRDRFVGPGAERVEAPAREPRGRRRPPRRFAAVLLETSLGIGDALGAANLVLVEAHRVHALRQEAAAIGIDQPKNAAALAGAEKSGRLEPAVGMAAPTGSRNVT